MAYAGIQTLMEKLEQLINCNHIPLFNHPSIVCEKPQFQLLYDELSSMIQTLLIYHDLQKVSDLNKRLICAVEEAQYIVDVFVSRVYITTNGLFELGEIGDCITSVPFNLDNVRRSMKSIKLDFMSMDSSQRTLNQSVSAPISSYRSSLRSKKSIDEVIVGLDHDAELIKDKLLGIPKEKLDVVAVVGMGGIGKTTLATKVFNDDFVRYHFGVHVWVTVSQIYDKRAVLTQILESIRVQLNLEKTTDFKLRQLVNLHLRKNRYLIVIDDIWDIETWDDLKKLFPQKNNGSRILLTSRITEVAKHATSDELIHHLGYLSKEKSWELLCLMVFQGNECPQWLIKPGMQIAENCGGLPLAVVVIAGVLAKEAPSEEFWVEIAHRTSSYIVGDRNGCMEILGLSYNHLPLHLRECFLYLGGFPEDYRFWARFLIWSWVAEGFIQQDGNRSLEDIAEGYLMDLIDRNLVIVRDRYKYSGGVKTFKVHDLIRELCMEKAKEERFILEREKLQFSNHITSPYKPVRLFNNNDNINSYFPYPSTQNLRTILCFRKVECSGDAIARRLCSFVLLRVLDTWRCCFDVFPKSVKLLVHLRYLAIQECGSDCFPSSICNLWNLQTLIYLSDKSRVVLPSNISDLVNLRHLWSYSTVFVLPSIEKPMNLLTITKLELGEGVDSFQKCFPYIKKLKCFPYKHDLKSLTYLEKLYLLTGTSVKHITFPASLKKLTLSGCRLAWSEMSSIQSLPNLEVLNLRVDAFQGSCWNTDGQEFPKLKYLILDLLNIKVWKAYRGSFPCLRQLRLKWCKDLEEIPLEIGEIPMLELIRIRECSHSVNESVRRIEEEQQKLGCLNLKIDIKPLK